MRRRIQNRLRQEPVVLILVHPSPRYGEEDLTKLSEAAVKRSEMVEIEGDLKSYSIPLIGKADK
jgi:hypothetical protein